MSNERLTAKDIQETFDIIGREKTRLVELITSKKYDITTVDDLHKRLVYLGNLGNKISQLTTNGAK